MGKATIPPAKKCSPNVVLVVDDSALATRTLARSLRDKTISVVQAQNGHEALAYLESGNVDVIVSDARMPELDGVTLLRIVSKRWPHIARVLYTGYIESYVDADADTMSFIDGIFSKGGQEREAVESVRLLAHKQGAFLGVSDAGARYGLGGPG
ncbi:MAG: response regulator [Proteobacteria bacterium]|nr:response regulator [Pseudomonadota bacterium]